MFKQYWFFWGNKFNWKVILNVAYFADPYSTIGSSQLTEWEKARERDEFSKAAKIFRPMSALMSSRFVRGAMIDDKPEAPLDTEVSAYLW